MRKRDPQKVDQVKRIDESWYQVEAQSLKQDSWCDVVTTERGFVCDCPDHQWCKVECKHIFTVEIRLQLRRAVKQNVVISPIDIQILLTVNQAK